ncbi:MAG: hypothetical protein OXH16_13605 [Gemmatimonadetes bacterium]|nr:hypothetical protein [Gemmatimonadota bacterium]
MSLITTTVPRGSGPNESNETVHARVEKATNIAELRAAYRGEEYGDNEEE